MKYITPLNTFLYFVLIGILGVAFVEYVFWTKHMFYEYAAFYIFAVFPIAGGIAAALVRYWQRKNL